MLQHNTQQTKDARPDARMRPHSHFYKQIHKANAHETNKIEKKISITKTRHCKQDKSDAK